MARGALQVRCCAAKLWQVIRQALLQVLNLHMHVKERI
jgi:hypothetical protein